MIKTLLSLVISVLTASSCFASEEALAKAFQTVADGGEKTNEIKEMAKNNPTLLFSYSNSENPDIARIATSVLGSIASPDGVTPIADPSIANVLLDTMIHRVDEASKVASIYVQNILPVLVDEAHRNQIVERLERSPSQGSALVVGLFPPKDSTKALSVLKAVRDDSIGSRRTVYTLRGTEMALARLGDDNVKHDLSDRLASDDHDEQLWAVRAMAFSKDREFIPELIEILGHTQSCDVHKDGDVVRSGIGMAVIGALDYMVNNTGRITSIGGYRLPAEREEWLVWWRGQQATLAGSPEPPAVESVPAPVASASTTPRAATPTSISVGDSSPTTEAPPSSGFPFTSVVMIVIALGGALVFLLRRKLL